METMKAIVCTKYGPPEVFQIEQRKKPIPREDEVLIKIYATSVTNSDIFIRSSKVPPYMMIPFRIMIGLKKPRNPIIGEVFSGEIEFAGSEIKRFKAGDQVYGFTGYSLGAYADYKCMKETDSKRGCLAVKPKNLSFEDATSAAYGGLLAFQFLEKGSIKREQKVLIYGASGTTGTIAVQYAKHLGAAVTGVCGSAHIEFVKSLGADKVLDYAKRESLSHLEKYDFILDAVGKRRTSELKKACRSALTTNGKYVSIDDGALLLQSDRLNKIREWVESGIIKPVTDRIYRFEQIIEAHRYVETGHKKGNVTITVNQKNLTTSFNGSDRLTTRRQEVSPMRKILCFFAASALLISTAFSQVPPTRTHMPDVPFFLRSMDFRSMQMAVFPVAASGMIEDPYSDLAWNPAFVLRAVKKSVYLNFNDRLDASGLDTAAASDYRKYYAYSTDDKIMASWVSPSPISGLNTKPLYNLAAVIPLTSRFALSVINRTLFDYAPFRSLGSYEYRDTNYGDAPLSKGETKRLSVDNDQQKMFGTQSQITLGYRLSDKIDLGLRWGLLTYDRDGDLSDSDRGIYPHSSFFHLQSETLGIKGHHIEAGIGLLWRLDDATRLGFYAGATWGKSEESVSSEDRNEDAYENDVKPAYYRQYSNALAGAETHPATGLRPALALTFEREISDSLRFRSFFSYTRAEGDLNGNVDSAYASASDYTYDYYDSATKRYYFRRAESQSRSSEMFQGTGNEKWTEFKGFVSMSYAPGKRWAVFGGLQIQRGLFDRTISETTVYALTSATANTLYRPGTDQYHHSYDKKYGRKTEEDQWTFTLPLGMKFEITKGFYAMLGTDLTMALTERHDRGDVLYLSKITRRWEDGRLLVNDEEYGRAEVYISDSPKVLKRSLGNRCGIVYEYNSVLTFHLRIEDNITQTSNWAFGFEVKW